MVLRRESSDPTETRTKGTGLGILTNTEKSGDQFHLRFVSVVVEDEISLSDTLAKITEVNTVDQTLNDWQMNNHY